MKKQAVIDRFEDDIAVILIESDQEEITVSKSQLPEGAKVGTWLILTKDEYALVPRFEIDTEKTEEMQSSTDDLMAQLRARKGSSYRTE